MEKVLNIVIGNIFINNFILFRFLGLCPFLGVSGKIKPALSMGVAVTFVMSCASIITWLSYHYLLIPFHLEYLRTITFILVIATFVQFVEMFILKTNPPLYKAMGIYLPLITTNCAVLGVAVLNNQMNLNFGLSLLQGICAGVGFTLAILLMSAIRERLDLMDVPQALRGIPIAFVVASLLSLAFMGFAGFKF